MQLCSSLSILWHCLSLGLEWKLTFSSPVVTAEFSKFAGILTAARLASLSSTIPKSLLKFMSIELIMLSSHLILFHLFLLPSIFPSINVFSNEVALCIRWPKDWSSSINPSNAYSWLISFRIHWFDHLAVKGTIKSLLHHQISEVSALQRWCCESAALNMPANLENSAVTTRLEKVSFHSNPKERQLQRMLKLPHNCTHLTRW